MELLSQLDALQIHGAKREEDLPVLDRRVIVATSPEDIGRFPNHEVIIDVSWGTGVLADWELLKGLKRPYILSGGLAPDNVGEAISLLAPAGVDVCSGVEESPGCKDPKRIRAFLSEVRAAEEPC
jgi:phosphoribosylanthranilate isomerase